MLNNFPGGENASQNAYGLYDDNQQPKIAAYAPRGADPGVERR